MDMEFSRESFRKWHILRKNTGISSPTRCIFFDTETTPEPHPTIEGLQCHKLRLWCASCVTLDKGVVTGRTEHNGVDSTDWLKFVRSKLDKKVKVWAFAHNIYFDLTVLDYWLDVVDGYFSFEGDTRYGVSSVDGCNVIKWKGMFSSASPPFIAENIDTTTKKHVVWLDSMNYYRCSLAELGEHFGLPKKQMPDFKEPDSVWLDYCKRDVEIVEKAMCDLIRMFRDDMLGRFKYTASALSMSAYKHKFMKHKLVVNGNKLANTIERESFYGGRESCNYIGRVITEDVFDEYYFDGIHKELNVHRIGPIYVLDCQSFYPSVMEDNFYPTVLKNCAIRCTIKDLKQLMAEYFCIARVTINSPNYCYPVKRNNKSFLASGEFITTLCHPELLVALNNGSVKNVGAVAFYEQDIIFNDFVDYFWDKRMRAKDFKNDVLEKLYKLLMNSIVGKFGQWLPKWVDVPNGEAVKPWGNWYEFNRETSQLESYRSIGWHMQRLTYKEESEDSIPSISSAVTSYGRVRLQRLIDIAGRQNVYYCDTDSLHVNGLGFDKLNLAGEIQDEELGKLSIRKFAKQGEYRGIKFYSLDDEWSIAGVKKNATKIGDYIWKQVEFQSLANILGCEPTNVVQSRDVTINMNKANFLGTVDNCGNVTEPVLNEAQHEHAKSDERVPF